MSRRRMFLRMLLRPLLVRGGSSAIAMLAIVVAATAATAMLTLFTDVQAKLRGEFRGYGANILVTSKSDASLPPDALQKVESQLGISGNAAPFGYLIAQAGDRSVVVVGIDVDRTKKVDPFWLATAWPESGAALLGARASKQFGKDDLELEFRGRKLRVAPNQAFFTPAEPKIAASTCLFSDFSSWSGIAPNTIEIAVAGRKNLAVRRQV